MFYVVIKVFVGAAVTLVQLPHGYPSLEACDAAITHSVMRQFVPPPGAEAAIFSCVRIDGA